MRGKKFSGLLPAFFAKILYRNDFMMYNRGKGNTDYELYDCVH
nr:MAG TPA: hypothetical protein [Caudoviricetes sp.]DAR74635.1 MAG TPA: hypothetical protein [Bacteriophage sp.]